MGSFFKKYFFVFLCLIFCACNEVVILQDISQVDANEVMVLFSKNGIQVSREAIDKQQKTSWIIRVNAKDEEKARELLVAHRLPRKKELGLSGVCKDAGLIPTPKTEKCREMLAIKGEVINSLESIPGVVEADVVINIPDKEDFPDENAPANRPRASVVVQVSSDDPGVDILNEAQVQRFVANAVTGMDLRDVAVIITRHKSVLLDGSFDQDVSSQRPPDPSVSDQNSVELDPEGWITIAGLKLTPRSAQKFKILAVFFLLLFVIMAVALIFILLKLARVRQQQPTTQSSMGHPALPEKAAVDRLVEETEKEENKKS